MKKITKFGLTLGIINTKPVAMTL